jgi:signal transduction histidine kinase/CheY-like chemotaxis protein
MSQTPETIRDILIADDEAIVVSLIRDMIEDEGHRVTTASDGQSALQAVKQRAFDLIVSDIRMPGMNGIELVRAARELQPDVAVIFITGYADLSSAKDAIQQGAYDYIMKPFELTEIRTAVNNALKKRSEVSTKSSEAQLTSLSKMNTLLFSAGDAVSLVSSSLRFMMMQEQADQGMALVQDRENNDYVRISIEGDSTVESRLPAEPLSAALATVGMESWGETVVIDDCLKHQVGVALQDAGLLTSVAPTWRQSGQPVIFIPIHRPDRWHGWVTLGYRHDPSKINSANLKYLDIASSQLAISLENLSLLKESQRAYSILKELQDQTIELEKMATRGVMSAEIGHEMNNFLAVVAGNLSLLQLQVKKQKIDQVERYATAINDTVEKMTVFTRNLMDLTPMSSKKERAYFDRILAEVLTYVHAQKRFRGIDICGPPSVLELPFEADPIQIQQLLYNLFNNAADAMIQSVTRRITVNLEITDDSQHFTFAITDTGAGFDTQVVAKAFQERFTTKSTGHGFGLVVCRRIIDNHGGLLDLKSRPGEGATISITFPLLMTGDDTAPDRNSTGRARAKAMATT